MIVTRSWLEEFIDLSDVSNDKLYETFNSIGLEVDSIKEYKIPTGIVVGKIISCEKHPDADKLNVCQIDIGGETKQIVCGAANVVDAKYVAVATIGAVLSEDFHIKPAVLRGIPSDGMVCSSTELGLPVTGDGIMILDDSIGELEIGKELGEYPKVSDTVIELELTANRGDCLSIHGVAQDLAAALKRDIRSNIDPESKDTSKIAIARRFSISNQTNIPVDLHYKLSQVELLESTALIDLRLAFVELELGDGISNILQYSTHATGVILRAYDAQKFQQDMGTSTPLSIVQEEHKLVVLKDGDSTLSLVGVSQSDTYRLDKGSSEILFEASYIEPQFLIEGVSSHKIETDKLYYKTSRGSESDLNFGMNYLESLCSKACNAKFGDTPLILEARRKDKIIAVSFDELNAIIGQEISKSEVNSILTRLGFAVSHSKGSDSFGVTVPQRRHDIFHVQDISEEILRIIGINNIQARPLELVEKVRITNSTIRYQKRKELRHKAVGRGFYEVITYAFSDKSKLEKYGFGTTRKELSLVNPIVEELNEMRSTLLVNLLDSVSRNVKYGIKKIPLFEIGTVFDDNRNENEKISFVWSGQANGDTVANHGKPEVIDFVLFVEYLSAVIGDITLLGCQSKNALMHPYQSASVIKNNQEIGYISKLHPSVADEYGISDTFIAEFDLEALFSKHITAKPVSNYQGVYKDLSIVVDQALEYASIKNSLDKINSDILRSYYPVDIYQDEALEDKKSITIRLFIQSSAGTMSDKQIDEVMSVVLQNLEENCGASIR